MLANDIILKGIIMFRYIFLTFSILLIIIENCLAFEIKMESANKLTVHAHQVPLQTLLSSIQSWGIVVKIDPQINPNISASFQDKDIQKGLNILLKSLNHIYVWNAVKGPWGKLPVLSEIHVFFPGKKDHIKPLDSKNEYNIARIPGTKTLYVKNELLVRLSQNPETFIKLIKSLNGVISEHHPGLSIYQVRFPPKTDALKYIDLLKKNKSTSIVEPNYGYKISKNYRAIPLNTKSNLISKAKALPISEVPIAILDTGLTTNSFISPYIITSYDAFQLDETITDKMGHGTNMANIVSGNVLPDGGLNYGQTYPQYIIPIRIFDDNGIVTNFQIINGIEFAKKNGAKILSMSWGSETYSKFLDETMSYSVSNGMIPIAGAGNSPTGKPFYPAAYESVIGVGATKADGSPWKRSNYGDFVEIQAPGFATFPKKYTEWPGRYVGTSISTAFVANQVATYLSKTSSSVIQQDYMNLRSMIINYINYASDKPE